MAVPAVVLGLVVAAAPTRLRRPLARVGVVLACLLLVGQLVAQVRPLSLQRDPHHRAISKGVRVLREGPYANRPGIAQHVLVRFLWQNAEAAVSNQHAIELWQEASPGFLFF